MKCNLNPTNYINITSTVMWNVVGTRTRMKPIAHFTHTRKIIKSPEEKRWVLRAELNDTRDGR